MEQTKLKGAHMTPLIDLLKASFYHLHVDKSWLEERAVEKIQLGHNKRCKQRPGVRGSEPHSKAGITSREYVVEFESEANMPCAVA